MYWYKVVRYSIPIHCILIYPITIDPVPIYIIPIHTHNILIPPIPMGVLVKGKFVYRFVYSIFV